MKAERFVVMVVDAFAAKPFEGNPAAVVFLTRPVDDAWMQAVAGEMKHSETAFLTRLESSDRPGEWHWGLRWFTPTTEVDLCGHATLASAHAVWERWTAPHLPGVLVFHTRSGPLVCRREAEPDGASRVAMEFPSLAVDPCEPPQGLFEGLPGIRPRFVGRSAFDYLVVAEDTGGAASIRRLVPDLAALRRVNARGVIVAAAGDRAGIDVVSRFFAPQSGIDEDPVTGSAHCVIGPWFGREFGKHPLTCEQASPRGGRVGVRLKGDVCELSGRAVTVLEGLLVAPS